MPLDFRPLLNGQCRCVVYLIGGKHRVGSGQHDLLFFIRLAVTDGVWLPEKYVRCFFALTHLSAQLSPLLVCGVIGRAMAVQRENWLVDAAIGFIGECVAVKASANPRLPPVRTVPPHKLE